MIFIIPTDTCFGIGCEITDIKSYHRIYEIKNRDFSKPFAIMVKDFTWLEKNTSLNNSQIDFLKKYKKPFTVLTDAPRISMILNLDQDDFKYENASEYKKIAFRVAHNNFQKNLIDEIGPIFLTSANFSGKNEIYSTIEAKKQFDKFLNEITFIPSDFEIEGKLPPSDIFEFEGESLDINYIRKN